MCVQIRVVEADVVFTDSGSPIVGHNISTDTSTGTNQSTTTLQQLRVQPQTTGDTHSSAGFVLKIKGASSPARSHEPVREINKLVEARPESTRSTANVHHSTDEALEPKTDGKVSDRTTEVLFAAASAARVAAEAAAAAAYISVGTDGFTKAGYEKVLQLLQRE